MRSTSLVGALTVLLSLPALATCGGSSEDEAIVQRGERLYADTCALCHGANGEGYVADDAPKLNSQELLSHASDAFLRTAIAEGRPGTTMSAWSRRRGGPLSDADTNAIVAYLRTWQTVPSVSLGSAPIAGDTAAATPVYEAECQSCHGPNGAGGRYIQLSNPVFLASASDAYIQAAIARGRPGTPMTEFGSRLPPNVIADLVALLRSWQKDPDGTNALPPRPGELTDVVLNPGGPDPEFDANARFIPVDVVKAAMDRGASFVIADARPPTDYAREHIAGAISVPFYEVEPYLPQIPKELFIITYCACPHAESGRAADVMRANGYPRVAVLDEGINVWRERGYPLRSGPKP